MYSKSPFAEWVPKPVMLLLILFFLLTTISINGVYSAVSSDIAGAMANYSEYVTLASNAGTIGTVMGMLVAMRFKMRFRSKELIVFSAVSTALLSYLIATSNNVIVLIAGNFLINLFKIPLMIEMLLPVMFIISPTGDKGKFYAIFYPIMLCFGQYSGYLFANMVNNGNWQTPYFVMSIMMLLVALCSIIFQHNNRFCFKMPLHQIDWFSLMLFAVSMMLLNYGLVFMRQQAWFNSPYIVMALIGGLLFFILFVYRQRFLKRKIIDFKPFVQRENIKHSIVLLFFLGLFMVGAGFSSQYTIGILGYNNLVSAQLNLWQIPGIIIAGIWAFYCFKNQWSLKHYISVGFLMYFFHILFLYLLIQPQMNIEYLYIIMVFRGLGMGILFIAIWFYGSLNLDMNQMIGVLGILMIIRTFLATSIGSAFLSWASYQGQWQSLNDITMYLDSGTYGMQLYQSTQIGAMLASLKSLWGMLLWCTIPILFFVLTHHYGQFNYRRLVLFRKRIRGDKYKGYRL